ncbi:MAG: Crp/Fnr family transcriptional regulator [Bacteroidetes bacterium]|nr:Crp/Fnr family transcriptional regulator [Bacteroidota bacterium]
MENLLRSNIEKTIAQQLTDAEFDSFISFFFKKSFEKRAVLTEEGKKCKYVYFLLSGAAYSYYINDEGEKTVIQFAIENYWITDQYSFFSEKPGLYFTEALEPLEAMVINRENYDALCCSNHLFEKFFRILLQNAFIALQYRIAKTNSEEAERRYLEYADTYPHFIQRIPQYLIASFLGIKPQSLSRIRKKIAEQH